MRPVLAAAMALAALLTSGQPAVTPGPRIYSADPADTWNRLFAALLTRTVRARFTSEFPDRGPFEPSPERFEMLRPAPPLTVSTRVFDRYEEGDRAIDALYPTFLNQIGPRDALREPRRAELVGALTAALNDRTPRSPVARALMQADLWSAYDGLETVRRERRTVPFGEAGEALTRLIAGFIGRIALTRTEIAALPDTYAAGRRALGMPDLFSGSGEWIEFVWSPLTMHAAEAHYRRSARILLRPAARPADAPAFLAALPREHPLRSLSAVALVEQLLLIDRSGRVVPSPIVQSVQLRTFTDPAGPARSSSVSQFELSRRRLLRGPASGGFVRFDDGEEAYLTVSGNDYGFATPAQPLNSEPTVTTMRVRCGACHGQDGFHAMSFALTDAGTLPPPRALPQPNDERARAVAAAKEQRDDFKRLVAAAFSR